MAVVLDASVALKWQFEDEEATGAAMVLLEDFVEGKIELITVPLFPFEVMNAINVAINRKRIGEKDGYKALDHILSLGIELRRMDDLIKVTFQMARKYQLSPYDCAYLALAQRENCAFITGDKKLFRTLKAYFPWAKWIGDYSS